MIVESYIGEQLASCDITASTESGQDITQGTNNGGSAKNNWPLIIGLAIGGIIILIAIVSGSAMAINKKRQAISKADQKNNK